MMEFMLAVQRSDIEKKHPQNNQQTLGLMPLINLCGPIQATATIR